MCIRDRPVGRRHVDLSDGVPLLMCDAADSHHVVEESVLETDEVHQVGTVHLKSAQTFLVQRTIVSELVVDRCVVIT